MGRKLTVYLIDGNDNGPRTIEIGNWSGKALYSPRANLQNILDRQEFTKPGVYVLKSDPTDDAFDERVYIGEAERIGERIKQHLANADRDFKEVIAFVSKDELLTKSHIKFIESKLVKLARSAKNSQIDNNNTPTESVLPEADISDMEYFIDQIKLILPVAGFQFLISNTTEKANTANPATNKESDIYYIEAKGITARLIETDSGFIVLKDSAAVKENQKSLSPGYHKLKTKLLETGILAVSGEQLVFKEDTVFTSLSAAASVVLGSSASGTGAWKDKSGKNYYECKKAQLHVENVE